MELVFYTSIFILGLNCFVVNGRAVNITNVWFLPQEGFPVFYKFFNDKVTWNEAEAVCGYHHADLLSVQTSAQLDAVRAYLKEIDVSENIWIGLKKESPEKPFSWTDGEALIGDGYWLEPIPKTGRKLCAAIDPVYDFRWKSYYCSGPQLASFVCELPVPDWAKTEDGCMVTSLPSLTITFTPEMGIVQLLSDCGLDGTRRIACKGGMNREEIVKRLSCDEDVFATTIFGKFTTDGAVKAVNTQEISRVNANREMTTQALLKSWETNLPQTRHKRDLNAQSPSAPEETSRIPETSTQVTSTQRVNVLHVPSRIFPHSPAERNSMSTHTPTVAENAMVPEKEGNTDTTTAKNGEEEEVTEAPNKFEIPVIPPKLIAVQRVVSNEETTKSPKELLNDPDVNKKANGMGTTHRPMMSSPAKEIPVLIITGETVNDSSVANTTPTANTSENPQLVFMVDEKKEGFGGSYLVPMGEDVIVNNGNGPSLSPMEVVDVDLIEIDNQTTAKPSSTASQSAVTTKAETVTETTQSSPMTPKTSHGGIHPLRLGEKNIVAQNATSTSVITTSGPSTAYPTITTTMAPSPSKTTEMLTTSKPTTTDNAEQISQNTVERDSRGDTVDAPQRPNRGRLLTHSNHPSFYPYFLNRVLG